MIRFLNDFFASIYLALRQPLETFIRLETADDEVTLVASDGSLVSYLKIDGAKQLIGDAEFKHIVEQAKIKIGSRLDRPGYAIQFYFVRDPTRIRGELETLMRPNRGAASNVGLELHDLFEERARHLSKFLAWEECYAVLWTRPTSLTSADLKREKQERRSIKWVKASEAQFPFAALSSLRTRHKSYVGSIKLAFDELNIRARVVDVHTALRAVRTSVSPTHPSRQWRACLPGDAIPMREPKSHRDYSDVLWPPIARQICTDDAEIISQARVRIGNLYWSPVDMTLGPAEPTEFPRLLKRLSEYDIPFRISWLIESAGTRGAGLRRFLVSIIGFTNTENKLIKNSLEYLDLMAKTEPVVRLRVSLATWASTELPQGKIDEQAAVLMQAFESWGQCQVSQIIGDPVEGIMSSALGISCSSTAPAGIAPLEEVLKLLPWQPASSPFDLGAILLRTPEGRIWPYQTGSTVTTTWFDLIFAQPGAGKSVLMNALSLGTVLTSGVSRLPYIAIIDIGPSSSGLISLIRDSLPPERRYEASHYRLRMTAEYAINPFDSQLGCRYPLPDERAYLIELLTLLCTPPGQEQPYDGITQLIGFTLDEMYRWRDDKPAGAEPRAYLPYLDHEVDEAIRSYNIHLPREPYWWDVVDMLFDLGLIHEAHLAQRHAVPTMTDAVTASRRPQIRALLEETKLQASTESVINAFERMIASAIREFPILASITRFDIGGARVCALDLMEVSPQGDDAADRQTAILYMLARHTLVRSWWLGDDVIRLMPEKYRVYHSKRLVDIRESPKRICYDEFHRTSKSHSVRSQVVRDVREGRKWGVQIVLASQLLEDFDDAMVDLATGVWILGSTVSEKAVDKAVERFGLSETARGVIKGKLTGPRSGGAPCLLVLSTNDGRYEQHLINTLGPIELWALSTSAEDVLIRSRLYARLGAQRARQILALNFPGGSARTEIRRRVALATEKGEVEGAATGKVIEELVNEMVASSIMQMKDSADRRIKASA
jgi:intracellular multiplication protein IcmB